MDRALPRLAPAEGRERVFDPVAADLTADRAERLARAESAAARVAIRLRCASVALVTALACHRLAWREHASLRAMGRRVATDLRHSVRLLTRRPAFTVAAVLTLGLGVGANAAIFSYVNHLLLADAPVTDASGLVRVFGRTASYAYDVVSFPNYRDLRDGVPGLDLAAHVQTPVRVGGAAARDSRTVELVTGNFFRVLRLTALSGRLIDDTDAAVEGSRAVVVISESYWRARHVRTAGAAEQVLPAVERAVRQVDPRIVAGAVTTLEALRRAPLFPGRALATTALAFGIIALLLTAVGVYGVVSASVGERTREIGVRMALGAESRRVQRDVLREALRLTAAGAAFGFLVGYLAATMMQSWLFQVGPFDGVAYLLVATLIGLAAIAAAWIPARRAAAIDPVLALR